MKSLSVSKEQLTESFRQLSLNWTSAKDLWRDAAREEFEKAFWQECEASTASGIEKLEELLESIAAAERDIP